MILKIVSAKDYVGDTGDILDITTNKNLKVSKDDVEKINACRCKGLELKTFLSLQAEYVVIHIEYVEGPYSKQPSEVKQYIGWEMSNAGRGLVIKYIISSPDNTPQLIGLTKNK